MSYTISPNMSLVIPGVGNEAGPDYATDVNNSLTIIDGHSHVAGSGVLITPAAININTDLSINNKSLTNVAALTLTAQSSTPVNKSAYVSGVDLYFVDGNGNNIRMTSGGTVNATSSGISSGSATASFVGGTLVVNSAALTPADVQVASVVMGNHLASSNYLTLQPPNAMAVSYSLTLPALPAQTNVLTLDTSGNISSVTWNAVANNRTRTVASTVGLGGIAVAASSGSSNTSSGSDVLVTNQTVTITTSGRPVSISLSPESSGGYISLVAGQTASTALFTIYRDGSGISVTHLTSVITGSNFPGLQVPSGSISYVDVVGAGTYTYQLYIRTTNPATLSAGVVDSHLVVYEL